MSKYRIIRNIKFFDVEEFKEGSWNFRRSFENLKDAIKYSKEYSRYEMDEIVCIFNNGKKTKR